MQFPFFKEEDTLMGKEPEVNTMVSKSDGSRMSVVKTKMSYARMANQKVLR